MDKSEITIYDDRNRGEVTEKQLQLIAKTLKKGKRVFGSSGASLTHQIWNPIYHESGINSELAKIGMDGEHKTSKMLRQWMKDKPNVVIVESVHIKGMGKEEVDEETGVIEGGDTDHILIIGSFVILIDSKNWKGKKKYSVSEKGEILRTGKPFSGGAVKATQALYLWKKYLKNFNLTYSSIINITSEKVFVLRDVNWWKQSFKVVTIENFIEFLDKIWDKIPEETKTYIDSDLVAKVVVNAIKPYDVVKEQIGNAAHLLNI